MNTLAAFIVALQMMQSGGDYRSVSSRNFLGAFQFGEAALTDLGFVRYDGDAFDNDYGGGWTGKHGITSAAQFLASKSVQDRAMAEWMVILWGYIELHDIDRYAWSEVGGVQLTPSGMLAGAHLLGAETLEIYVRSNGRTDPCDPFGTPISSYIRKLNGYDVLLGPHRPNSGLYPYPLQEGEGNIVLSGCSHMVDWGVDWRG
ncbi:hypothetical protein [Tabrizicola sp. BL-A-41-H6]|uniref:hypothetical protein n=1 Tax=Tabrizicola sp. BL-A-41-H6 TaxID=3421107 RepID=UPI003D67F617